MFKIFPPLIAVTILFNCLPALARVSTLDCQQDSFHMIIEKDVTQTDDGTIGMSGLDLTFKSSLTVDLTTANSTIQHVVKYAVDSNDYNVAGADKSSLSSQYLSGLSFTLNHVFVTANADKISLVGTISGYENGVTTYLDATISGAVAMKATHVPCSYQIHDY